MGKCRATRKGTRRNYCTRCTELTLQWKDRGETRRNPLKPKRPDQREATIRVTTITTAVKQENLDEMEETNKEQLHDIERELIKGQERYQREMKELEQKYAKRAK